MCMRIFKYRQMEYAKYSQTLQMFFIWCAKQQILDFDSKKMKVSPSKWGRAEDSETSKHVFLNQNEKRVIVTEVLSVQWIRVRI